MSDFGEHINFESYYITVRSNLLLICMERNHRPNNGMMMM